MIGLDDFDLALILAVDVRYPGLPDRAARLLRGHGRTRPIRTWLNGFGVPGLDPAQYDAAHAEPPASWTIGRGQWGCFQAYRSAFAWALDRRVRSLLVIEDDLRITPDFAAICARAAAPEGWQFLSFGQMTRWPGCEPGTAAGYCLRRCTGRQYGMHGAAWRPAMMAAFLEEPVDCPADHAAARLHRRFPSYAIHPAVIRQGDYLSSNEDGFLLDDLDAPYD